MPGESYTSPVTGETYTVPTYEDPADAPIAFKDFADTITGGGGIDIPATRVDAVVQTLDGSTWAEGMALSVVSEVPADSEGQVGDVVFVSGKSPAPSGAANFTDTATGNYTENGVNYKYLTVTGTQSVTFDTAGFADVLLVGAGGGGGNDAAGGAGGFLSLTNVYIPLGAQPVVIGAGGVGTVSGVQPVIGSATVFRDYYSVGGGGGGWVGEAGVPGASGGGNARSWSGLVPGIPGLGNSTTGTFGSGGGAGGAGSGGSGDKLGGPGLSSNITGAAVFYAGGGNVGETSTAEARTPANTAGAVNSGSGGGNLAANNGGSGVAIIRVEI